MSFQRMPIGQLLVRMGVVDAATVEEAAQRQAQTGLRLASQIWAMAKAPEKPLVQALATQLGTPGVVIGESSIELRAIQELPAMMAVQRNVIPIGLQDDHLQVAAADPLDTRLTGEMKLISSHNIVAYVALQGAITKAVSVAYAVRPDANTTHWYGWDADTRMPGFRSIVTPPEPQVAQPETVFTGAPPIPVEPDIPEIEIDIDDLIDVDTPDAPAERAKSNKPILLIVDDDDTLTAMIAMALERLDVEIVVCHDGREAAAQLQTIQPRIMILDVMLPGMHGFELARMVHGSERFADSSLIMMSGAYKGWRVQRDVQDGFGADAFFEKPFELAELREKCQALLGQQVADKGASHEAQTAFKSALELQKAGKIEDAEKQLQTAIRHDPFFIKAHLLLAVIYTKMGRQFLATDTLELIVDLDPKNYKALASLAAIYEKEGFRHKAAGTWERALVAAPDDATREQIRKRLSKLLFQPSPSG